MAIIRKAPNGELVSFPDGTTEAQIQEAFNSEQYQSAKTVDKPTTFVSIKYSCQTILTFPGLSLIQTAK